jgi:hypothetical protein
MNIFPHFSHNGTISLSFPRILCIYPIHIYGSFSFSPLFHLAKLLVLSRPSPLRPTQEHAPRTRQSSSLFVGHALVSSPPGFGPSQGTCASLSLLFTTRRSLCPLVPFPSPVSPTRLLFFSQQQSGPLVSLRRNPSLTIRWLKITSTDNLPPGKIWQIVCSGSSPLPSIRAKLSQ